MWFLYQVGNEAGVDGDRLRDTEAGPTVQQRLQELEAVESLADMVFGRPHELKGDRAGEISVDLVHPLRLIFRPTAQPPPTKTDGGLDRAKVKSVIIIEVTDPH